MSDPTPLASRAARPQGTRVDIGHGVVLGGLAIPIIAGPCAIESADQLARVARICVDAGAVGLRGGAWKGRTSPYAFQGLGERGLELLAEQGRAHGIPVVSEILDAAHLGQFTGRVDVLQIGARNMQTTTLLEAVGRSGRPVLLKRGLSATVDEWLLAAEYILHAGNPRVILCERGVRTFEPSTRFTLDVSAVAVAKLRTHLPVVVDPSHAAGRRDIVLPLARAAVAAGADGLLVEVHDRPDEARSDGPQALLPEQLVQLVAEVRAVARALGRDLATRAP